MNDLGYNTNIMKAFNVLNTELYDTMRNNGLNAIVIDGAWDPATGASGFAPLTTACYHKFEAEFVDEDNISSTDATDSRFWYGTRSEFLPNPNQRYGIKQPNQDASNGYVWRYSPVQAPPGGVPPIPGVHSGFAYTNLTYRWQYRDEANNTATTRVGKEFRVYKYSNNYAGNYFYISFKLKYDLANLQDLPDNTVLLEFMPSGYQYSGSGHSQTGTPLNHTNGTQSGNVTYLTKGNYNSYPVDYYGFIMVELVISYADLLASGLMIDEVPSSSRWLLVNLNPVVKYYDYDDFLLDYIEYEDHMHREMMQNYNTGFSSGITQRLNTLIPAGYEDMVTNIYTMDEPFQPHFDSYKRVQTKLQEDGIEPLTAIYDMHFRKYQMNSAAPKFYDHIDNFKKSANPSIIMPDIYPIRADYVYQNWNAGVDDLNYENSLQWMLDNKLIAGYLSAKHREAGEPDRPFYPVVQTFGHWNRNVWNSWILPPANMIKMLQYLPLCFDADGIFNYRLYGLQKVHGGEVLGDYAAFNAQVYVSSFSAPDPSQDSYGTPTVFPPVYNAIQEANAKINVYTTYLKGNNTTWQGSNTINVNSATSGVSLAQMHMSEIDVCEPEPGEPAGPYDGFVQCGYYLDGSGLPFFMVVNRRSNYFEPYGSIQHPNMVPVTAYNSCFPAFSAQQVEFTPAASAHALFGTNLALYDPYDGTIYPTEDLQSRVTLEPGDGRLLQMYSTLPAVVSGTNAMLNRGIIDGNIVLEQGSSVTVGNGTIINITPNSQITVSSGSSFTFRGTVHISDNVTISVLNGGTVNFQNATCFWGQDAILEVSGGNLNVDGVSWDKAANATKWQGFRICDNSIASMNNLSISGAHINSIVSSSALITDCNFSVPANAYGLLISNINAGQSINVINTESGHGFSGDSNLTSKGITFGITYTPVYIENVEFQNLYYGITKTTTPHATDVVSQCHFVNCGTGIRLINNKYATDIQECRFTNNQAGKQGTGIQLVASSPPISLCEFTSLYCGVFSEYTVYGGMGMETGITESNFYNCEMGMETRSASHRLKANYFNRNNSGIVNHAGSNLNLSLNANNVFMNRNDNIKFYDFMPYESTIQLFVGHNDFYHLTDNTTGLTGVDFYFDANYFNFPLTPDYKINASKNWFQADQVTFNDVAYQDYVYVDLFDPSASMPAPPPEADRLFIALDYESQGMYELAVDMYKTIIDQQLDEEKTYITSAIDGLYRCTAMIPNPTWEITDYFDLKAVQCAIDDPNLSTILKEYLGKAFVLKKEYQAAVDLIQIRIDNPISELDSLRAVLDLEIVLQIAAMEEDKRPISTKYTQYRYPDIQVFETMHSSNWDKYIETLDKNAQETASNLSPIPQLQSNYPNPFNPSTTIAYSLPATGQVRISVYNMKGQKVKDLLNSEMLRGKHKVVWDGKDANNNNVSSGIYFFRLEIKGHSSVRKAMLMK
ncbi:MAG: T9SS type A sorting domain-containing protein [Candidatus Cloacimonadaceae bacterium]|nr:T9SS type A sorting domain-containing protein [Candidatus Cloacimonadota bacterium]MDD3103906.1 T9SS type A sorting domain-containing protein [Candidatus Cloacimonadota bacterium]MDY0128394.1 T9SS type A sorting domain-containing protein [Candidatus Cloacimonadaceae bacterium]